MCIFMCIYIYTICIYRPRLSHWLWHFSQRRPRKFQDVLPLHRLGSHRLAEGTSFGCRWMWDVVGCRESWDIVENG